ncbi:DUF2267 domain-containing protein [Kitasatospora sp. NPDC017646]|uniref:DUF2267 domain-containing protein n=1 Tax=Kitasatospora sp. NPDC017646 TaxID=3364024 RepID=UPI003798DFED
MPDDRLSGCEASTTRTTLEGTAPVHWALSDEPWPERIGTFDVIPAVRQSPGRAPTSPEPAPPRRQLRDRLPTDVVAHLGAQLPTLVRGVFYEGWNPHPTPAKFDRQEYLDRFSHEASLPAEDAEDIVRAVTRAVFLHIPPEQLEHVFDTLPHDLRSLVTPAA